ncbi:MAG TPA: winged helix-turn-helix transcriptional regulator [Pseudonocardiaceae bacterium]
MTGESPRPGTSGWTFLSNHAHVMVCLHREPELTIREIAGRVGITTRGVQIIIGQLAEEGYLVVNRSGRRNSYALNAGLPLRHPLERDFSVLTLLTALDPARGRA